MPGPVGKRDAERRRRNKPDTPTVTVDIAELTSLEVVIPEGDSTWHPAARLWYDSLARSGQAIFYEPSDWATAWVLAEALDRELSPQPVVTRTGEDVTVEMMTIPIKGASLTALLKGMTALMVTEGDRRRLSIELERKRDGESLPAGVADITQSRRDRLAKASGAST